MSDLQRRRVQYQPLLPRQLVHFSGVEDSDVTGFNSEFRFLEKVFPHLKQVKSVRIKPAPSKGSNMGAQAMN